MGRVMTGSNDQELLGRLWPNGAGYESYDFWQGKRVMAGSRALEIGGEPERADTCEQLGVAGA